MLLRELKITLMRAGRWLLWIASVISWALLYRHAHRHVAWMCYGAAITGNFFLYRLERRHKTER